MTHIIAKLLVTVTCVYQYLLNVNKHRATIITVIDVPTKGLWRH